MVGGLQHTILGDPLSAPVIHLLNRGPCSLDRSTVVVLLLVVSSCQMTSVSSAVFGCNGQAFSADSSPVLSRTTVFRSMFQRLTLGVSLKHTSFGRFSTSGRPAALLPRSLLHTEEQTSLTSNTRILVAMLMFLLRNSFLFHICYTQPAFSSLTAISFCTFPD